MICRVAIPSVRVIGAALLVAAGLAVPPASDAARSPRAFVADLGQEAIQVMGPSVPRVVREAKFRRLFNSDFDLPGIARFVLGPYGHSLTPPQQQEFLALFRESLVQAYSTRLAEYAGEPFHVTGSRSIGPEIIVTSQVVKADGKPVELDWHLLDRHGHYLIADVVIGGVSMRLTQRQTFAGIIQRNGGRADSLIAVLRQHLAEAHRS
jgi:phospholipid transport system substrate-binding protein